MCDSLEIVLERHSTIVNDLKLKKVLKRNNLLDFYFDESLGDYPWRENDIKWFKAEVRKSLPEGYGDYLVGNLYANGIGLAELVTPELGNDGTPAKFRYMRKKPRRSFITRTGAMTFERGLSGRSIALWQSHGRYYNEMAERWEWQRAPLFTTVEDLFTQSFVLPYLIPMLENAGAYVLTPRERDLQKREFIIDNDLSFTGDRNGLTRRCGLYHESGKWKDAGVGFADTAEFYQSGVNPFSLGTARMAECSDRKGQRSEIRWNPNFPSRDNYAVYISYKSLPNSSRCAHYTVRHAGGTSEFAVDQRCGGGTWIYLGTFCFEEGDECYVSVDNTTPAGFKPEGGCVVTADAVKIGGGMGKIIRGPKDETDPDNMVPSGMPSYAEGALYSMQWSGIDTTLTKDWATDYVKDYASRGAWTKMMKEEKGLPVDMSLAIHTDAGLKQLDSTVGTLAIYTLKCEGSRKFADGSDRMSSRDLADAIQTQLCNDVRTLIDSSWNRRQIWDRSYSESRTTGVPGLLLEILSHQNFNDMKYGLDPNFRFTVCRSIYKGALKFLSNLYEEPYTVQPLPVKALAVNFGSDPLKAAVSWDEVTDDLEPTAGADGYILYTRIDDGVFDDGVRIGNYRRENGRITTERDIAPGHLYSFKVAAYNKGGISFPSEVLCIGAASGDEKRRIMVVNNFDRVSGPAWIDSDMYAGFDCNIDGGVPYMLGIEHAGKDYEFRREQEFVSNEYAGFGASHIDMNCSQIKGNTFDFASVHAKALMDLGYNVFSVSRDAWTGNGWMGNGSFAADIICGKQVSTVTASSDEPVKYRVFPKEFKKTIETYAEGGGHLIISGADIATDVWSSVFPVAVDSLTREDDKAFVGRVFGYVWRSGYGSHSGQIKRFRNRRWATTGLPAECSIDRSEGENIYIVENPDALSAASIKSFPVLRYADSNLNAGIYYESKTHKAASYGFPLETLTSPADISAILSDALRYFSH